MMLAVASALMIVVVDRGIRRGGVAAYRTAMIDDVVTWKQVGHHL